MQQSLFQIHWFHKTRIGTVSNAMALLCFRSARRSDDQTCFHQIGALLQPFEAPPSGKPKSS